jgi:beta-glucuronidase
MFRWARALGATLIRSESLHPAIEELADRTGVLLWSDIPVTGDATARGPALQLLKEDILANQSHPSVLLWSIANELPTPATQAEATYVARASSLAHRLDPTRPVGMAVSAWPGVSCQIAYRPLDAIGLNEYFGWYDSGGGATDDREALGTFLDSLRACYPRKALFISEFGFDGTHHGPVEERGTFQFQANSAAYHLRVFASKQWLAGAIYFLLQNAVSFPGYTGGDPFPLPPFNLKGLIDFNGARKPAFSVVSAIYHRVRQIAP